VNIDLAAVYGIGVLTLATPCILPLLPIYLGLLLGEGLDALRDRASRWRLLSATAAFSGGFVAVFTGLGLGASAVGSLLQTHRLALTVAGGVVIALFGLKLLGVLRVPWLDREVKLPHLRTGARLVDAGLFGVVFALGWTPCVGPILGSVLTYTASRSGDPLVGALYLSVYGLGVATPLLVLGLFADRLVPKLGRLNRFVPVFSRVTGVALLVLAVGLAGSAAHRAGFWVGAGGPPMVERVDGGAEAPRDAVGEPSERPRLVQFFRDGCAACERAHESVEALRSDCAGRRIEILAVDAEAPGNRALASRYGLTVVPTFVLLGTDGQERGRLVGAPPIAELRLAAASLMAETCAGVGPAGDDGLDDLGLDRESAGEEGCSVDGDGGAIGDEVCAG
jgi:cytochrome c-type biogenesis protein